MASPKHNVFVGAETGLLKGVNTREKHFQNLNDIKTVDKQQEVCVMCWGNDERTKICCGLKNRLVKMYTTDSGSYETVLDVKGGDGPLKALALYNGYFLTCVESGLVKVWTKADEDEELSDEKIELDVGPNICKLRQNPQNVSVIATGGKENKLKLWDLQRSTKPIFVAKNLPNDFLDHRIPIWESDLRFFPDGRRIVTCTGHSHIRVYETNGRVRRPVINMEFDEYPLTALSLTHNENYVVVGNSRGRMGLFDLRKKLLVHIFRGFAGSIRCVECHPSQSLVASCGLDRFLRIHDINTRKLLHKIYLKSRLNCLLYCDDVESPTMDTTKIVDGVPDLVTGEEAEDDEIWNTMENVSDNERKEKDLKFKQVSKKKRKIVEGSVKRNKINKK